MATTLSKKRDMTKELSLSSLQRLVATIDECESAVIVDVYREECFGKPIKADIERLIVVEE
jgi:hypothetical protein